MFNYSIDYTVQVNSLLPTFLRRPRALAYLRALVAPIASRQAGDVNHVFGSGPLPIWGPATVTNRGDRVRRGLAVYVQTSPEVGLSGMDPLLLTHFAKVLDDFRGLKQRTRHNSQKTVLEYILNEVFGTVFRQPGEGFSDVWIQLTPQDTALFWVGETAAEASFLVGDILSADLRFVVNGPVDIKVSLPDFVVMYPASLPAVHVTEIDGIVGRYMVYGTNYTKQSY